MNILFCGDENVENGIWLSSLSICKHTDCMLHIYILTATMGTYRAISNNFAANLQRRLELKNPASKVLLIDISEMFQRDLPVANMKTRFTPLCMLRLYADEILQIPDRILYLDTDVLCRGEFSDFYHLDIDDVEIAGVPDRYGKWFFGNVFKHDYLNSGVLLLNMKKIRASGLFKKCRALCREKNMFMPDQTALNKLSVKQKVQRRYNEQGKIKSDTVFKHFTTYFRFFPYFRSVTIKPWEVEKLHSELGIFEFDDILEKM